MRTPSCRRRLLPGGIGFVILCVAAWAAGVWALARPQVPSLFAQSPGERPHLSLPFQAGDAYPVSCGYTCYQHRNTMTYAVDFAMPADTPVVAAADGVVAAITWEIGLPADKHLGDALVIYLDHGGGWLTRYVHLSGITVQEGQRVRRGEIIGYAGATGTERAHLHFELKHGATLRAPSQPVDELFGGRPPQEGHTYTSDNVAPAVPPLALRAGPTATPTPASPLVLEAGVSLSATSVQAGEPVTVTFTLRNGGTIPLTLALVGLVARGEDGRPVPGTLSAKRDVSLAPGARWRLSAQQVFLAPGTFTLAPFAFDEEVSPLPLAPAEGTSPTASLRVTAGHSLYLPLVVR